jgi:hypothetical protein
LTPPWSEAPKTPAWRDSRDDPKGYRGLRAQAMVLGATGRVVTATPPHLFDVPIIPAICHFWEAIQSATAALRFAFDAVSVGAM